MRERGAASRRASSLTALDVRALRDKATRFGDGQAAAKAAALAACRSRRIDRARVLADYHDTLLFLTAHPDSDAIARAAERELRRVAAAARALPRREAARLQDSGIAWSEVDAGLSFEIARWLERRHKGQAEITAFVGDGRALAGILAVILPPIDGEMIATAGAPLALLDKARGAGRSRLAFLVDHLDRLRAPAAVREHLYDAIAPLLRLSLRGSRLSRTFARGLPATRFLQSAPLVRSLADPRSVIDAPLPAPRALSTRAKTMLVDTARATLASLARETDPVTWPSRDGVTLYELERGVAIALYPMEPARRFALDSHTGYLLFRNRVPAAYGGGWPFLRACRIGVNIFPALRGGESSWLFAQVLRAYRRHFGVARFVVEPYQFGAGNREGLASGAFWFYYRLGFRPVARGTARLARTEFARIERARRHRPSLATMRALTESDLALDLDATAPRERVEPALVSLAVSRWIGQAHAGDRRRAQLAAVERVTRALGVRDRHRWPASERTAFESLSLAIALVDGLERWSADERSACVSLMRAKGASDDAPYFRQLAAHAKLGAGLLAIAALA